MFRLSRIRGRHYYVLFGWPLVRLSVRSHYLKLRDLERAVKTREAIGDRPVEATITTASVVAGDGSEVRPYYLSSDHRERRPVAEMCAELARYDVISFDIFDTAVFRTVESPADVFRIVSARTGVSDFVKLRRSAEQRARQENEAQHGSREVTLDDIYRVLEERHGISRSWAQVEADLEASVCRANPYILAIYAELSKMGKDLVFMTDMYLPRPAIEKILKSCGYSGFSKLLISNEHGLRKGDGTLQRVLLDDCATSGKSVVHIGDSLEGDVEKSSAAGLPAIYNRDQRGLEREPDMNGLSASVYRAVVNNSLDAGTWHEGLHYTHGFRVGGILTAGFCEYIEKVVAEKSIDKILFCGRDCAVISRVYESRYGSVASTYVEVSRYSVLGITLDRYFEEYVGRSFFRALSESRNSKPLFQIMEESGFGYLIPYLEAADIDKYLFSGSVPRRKLDKFFWDHRDVVIRNNEPSVDAAREYFGEAVGDAERILIVDVGWTGTAANALRYFIGKQLPGERQVYGALMCTSRDPSVADAASAGWLSCYAYSPLANADLSAFMMPEGRRPARVTDRIHLPLEYLFTEACATVTGYDRDGAGRAIVLRGINEPKNPEQIREMQRGICDFVDRYLDYAQEVDGARAISPYVAMRPLTESIRQPQYTYDVYKDFIYDAAPVLFGDSARWELFGELFEAHSSNPAADGEALNSVGRGKILFISPEMLYAGAPRSLLRMCKVARDAGYEPVVWTAKPGPFMAEFQAIGLRVSVVPPQDVDDQRVQALQADGVRLVVCNTVVTDRYVRTLEGRLPLVWYIREAANIPDFFRASPERMDMVRSSRSICAVSEYAASQISQYASHPIRVVRNSVEDVSEMALPYVPDSSRKHRFVQLGTIEHRKGYDLFISAFLALPAEYRRRAELHFAGGFINSGASFSSYLFGRVVGEADIHYHGLITSEREKIELLSQMDTVVVASRDESCSLVALEGAMLSKPLVVTSNVGAKYMVSAENGFIVESGSVEALRDAFIKMIDCDEQSLSAMGRASRRQYEELASMKSYHREVGALFASRIAEGAVRLRRSDLAALGQRLRLRKSAGLSQGPRDQMVVVSLTSFPPRMPFVAECVSSLLGQTLSPDKIILWLSRDQFPRAEDDLPTELLALVGKSFAIEWVDGDLGPHKKYFYAAQRYPDAVVITVDDDVVYDPHLVEYLYEAHLEQPHTVVCERANLVLFRPEGGVRAYDSWVYDCGYLRGTLTYQLLPTGVGGVLYPARCLPPEAFDEHGIRQTCLYADDLWLKVMAAANGYPVWMPRRRARFKPLQAAQHVGLWRTNSLGGGNDIALKAILEYVDERYGFAASLMRRLQGVGHAGELLEAEEIGMDSLFISARDEARVNA